MAKERAEEGGRQVYYVVGMQLGWDFMQEDGRDTSHVGGHAAATTRATW